MTDADHREFLVGLLREQEKNNGIIDSDDPRSLCRGGCDNVEVQIYKMAFLDQETASGTNYTRSKKTEDCHMSMYVEEDESIDENGRTRVREHVFEISSFAIFLVDDSLSSSSSSSSSPSPPLSPSHSSSVRKVR